MEQLSGLDASFLNMETKTAHGHVGSVAVFDVSRAPMTLDSVRELIRSRLHELAPYRRRLMTVPLDLDRPYWIEDGEFDLEFHVRHIAVPPPGDDEQLADLVARLHSQPLDRSRPLWELYLIEGLGSGRVAQYTKIHHACIDGITGTEVMTTLLDTDPAGRAVAAQAVPWSPDRSPSGTEMLARGVVGLASQPRAQLRLARSVFQVGRRQVPPAVRTAQEALGRTPGISALVPRPRARRDVLSEPGLVAPRVSFNRSISAHRRFAFASLPLDDIRDLKARHGTTVNDVVMAICAGGLRRWLRDRQELPTDPLLALVPVSVRTADTSGPAFGNSISAMIAALPTDEDDPLRRLRRAHEVMAVAKNRHQALPADLLQDFGRFAPPAVAARAARLIARTRLADIANPPFNLVISNIPGPQHPLYCDGARQIAAYPVSVVSDGVGLNITLWSYDGQVHFGLVACREAVTDLWGLTHHIQEELTVLTAASRSQA